MIRTEILKVPRVNLILTKVNEQEINDQHMF